MRFPFTSLVLTLLLFAAAIPAAAAPPQAAGAENFDLLKEMTVSDFRAAGLDKLTDEQIKTLGDWFADYLRQHNCAAVVGSAASAVASSPTNGRIQSRLTGRFTGWDGWTKFTLDNGQVWEQLDHEEMFSTAATEHPVVTISQGALNSWYLSVKGFARTVRVHRVK